MIQPGQANPSHVLMTTPVPKDIAVADKKDMIIQPTGSVFHQHWAPRGHVFGTCMSRSDSSLMYVNIPKCASSWTKPNLIDHQFQFYNYHSDNLYHKHALIVLRDPLTRWLSGVCEFFALYHRGMDLNTAGKPFYELVLDLVTLDDHTEKQVYFITDLDPQKCTYLYCDKEYRVNFAKWLRSQGIANRYENYDYQHTTDGNPVRERFKAFFKEFMYNKQYVDHIKAHYKLDYDLINSVRFWRG